MGKYTETKFLKELSAFAEEQRQLIETDCLAFDSEPAERKTRRGRVLNGDYRFFCRTYFPHYIKEEESLFHTDVFDEFPVKVMDKTKGYKEVRAAPRGEAKSTLFTQLGNLFVIVAELKKFPVILMDSFDQAAMMLEAIKVELESNPRLKMDFPEACGAGRVWQTGVIITANKIKVQVAGSGKKVRGWRHGPHRPDMVVLDDIENDENVRKIEQRNKTENWLKKAVLKLGPPDGTMDVFYIGTILHYDSVLNRTLKNPVWNGRVFKAIMRWPDNMDLWEAWEEILINEGEEESDRFYLQNKEAMDKGAVLSWPKTRPLLRLMKERADDHHAFDCEYQNDPTNDENAPFKNLTYWVQPYRKWIFYGSCDPSMGKRNRSRDPSAILVGGFDREHGLLDVVEAKIKRRVPDMIISDVIEFQREYGCLVWGVETIQFQEFFKDEMVKRSAAVGVPVPARGITPNTDKDLRIESLQPHVANGLIRFNRNHSVLLEQLLHWPEADHDDGPDALHMLWMVAVSRMGGLPSVLSARRASSRDLRGYDNGR
ncbi:MAG: hypothetical protein C9356_12345 [Oleiphilus sp.]|nr:MAG: hypothetical protein C9356_12345 [Oleiphilus sp.]